MLTSVAILMLVFAAASAVKAMLMRRYARKSRPNQISGGESDGWASTHPWASTAHGPAVTRLRERVADGSVPAWDYDFQLDEILRSPALTYKDPSGRQPCRTHPRYNARPSAPRELDEARAALKRRWYENHAAPSGVMVLEDGLKLEQFQKAKQNAKGPPTGSKRPSGYVVWKKGVGWTRNVAETETIETWGGNSHKFVTSVEDVPINSHTTDFLNEAVKLGYMTLDEARAALPGAAETIKAETITAETITTETIPPGAITASAPSFEYALKEPWPK